MSLPWRTPWYPANCLAPAWTLRDVRDGDHSLGDYHGKPVVALFSLGYGCLHCAKQLQAFGDSSFLSSLRTTAKKR